MEAMITTLFVLAVIFAAIAIFCEVLLMFRGPIDRWCERAAQARKHPVTLLRERWAHEAERNKD